MGHATTSTEWPSIPVPTPVKDLISTYFSLMDNWSKDVGDRLADEIFTKDGKLVAGHNAAEGTEQIRRSRDTAWGAVKTRNHEILRAYVRSQAADDLLLIGRVNFGLLNGKELSGEFVARFIISSADTKSPKVKLYQKLVCKIRSQGLKFDGGKVLCTPYGNGVNGISVPSGPLEQHHFWNQFNSFLREGDCIIAEVGSAQYGTLELDLPRKCKFFTQLYYNCIGFTVGALLGALVARREQGHPGRVILFIGDGSLHMTVQELSTIIRQGFHPTIVLINNQWYTIERVIHGPTQRYNDISETWDYQSMLRFFGASPKSKSYQARTYAELAAALGDEEFINNEHPQLLECFLDKFDSPWMLTKQVNLTQERSRKQLMDWDKQWGRKRHVLDTNLFQNEWALTQSESHRYAAEDGKSKENMTHSSVVE